jgi:hypothetical protein
MKGREFVRVIALVVVLLALAVPLASAAPAAAKSAAQTGCTYRATYVADVTIPDSTVIAPGKPFVKTWRIRNDGTCPWGPGTIVDTMEMVGGSMLAASTRVPLNEKVGRGQTADISIKMQAPVEDGTYRSEWKFRRSNGALFGLGASGATPFYVQIVVRSGGSATPPPDNAQRINFPPGATVVSLQGRVSDTGSKSYLVKARKGQPMRVAVVSANPEANFSIVGVTDGQPYKRVEVGEPWYSMVLPSSQDYRITVRVASGAGTATYVLAIAIGA